MPAPGEKAHVGAPKELVAAICIEVNTPIADVAQQKGGKIYSTPDQATITKAF